MDNQMHIGSLEIVLILGEGSSLKEKRSVIRRMIVSARQKFNISIAEVDDLDKWRRATIACVCVSRDAAFVNQVLDKTLDFIESNPNVSVADVHMEIL
jgi:uncharacterized protein YlxP (DUF503 family)